MTHRKWVEPMASKSMRLMMTPAAVKRLEARLAEESAVECIWMLPMLLGARCFLLVTPLVVLR